MKTFFKKLGRFLTGKGWTTRKPITMSDITEPVKELAETIAIVAPVAQTASIASERLASAFQRMLEQKPLRYVRPDGPRKKRRGGISRRKMAWI